MILTGTGACWPFYALILLRGRTQAGPGAIRNRLAGRETRIAWTDVGQIVVFAAQGLNGFRFS